MDLTLHQLNLQAFFHHTLRPLYYNNFNLRFTHACIVKPSPRIVDNNKPLTNSLFLAFSWSSTVSGASCMPLQQMKAKDQKWERRHIIMLSLEQSVKNIPLERFLLREFCSKFASRLISSRRRTKHKGWQQRIRFYIGWRSESWRSTKKKRL